MQYKYNWDLWPNQIVAIPGILITKIMVTLKTESTKKRFWNNKICFQSKREYKDVKYSQCLKRLCFVFLTLKYLAKCLIHR